MTKSRNRLLLTCCLVVSTLSAGVVVALEFFSPDDAAARRNEFQSLVEGLGYGSSVDLSECSFSFDPRLGTSCSHLTGPVPGGFFLCSKHVGSVTGYPHLLPDVNTNSDTNTHAASR